MQPSLPAKAHRATAGAGLWYRWRGYAVRWILFGIVVQLFQPMDDLGHVWQQRLYQALTGLLFGALCAIVFTIAENTVNLARITWKSWLIVIATWIAVKVAFVSTLAAVG